jgi:hypothetical protein
MNKAELLAENTRLRQALYRPERSRLTQLRADLMRENKEMRAELASRREPFDYTKRPRQVKRPLRASRRLRALTWSREKS